MFDANNTEHVLDLYRKLGFESTYGMSDDIVRDFIKFCRKDESLIQYRYRLIEESKVKRDIIQKEIDNYVCDKEDDEWGRKGAELRRDLVFAEFPESEILREITSDFDAVLSQKRTNEFNTIWNKLNAEQTHFH